MVSFDERIATVLELAPAAISFVYGIPTSAIIERAHLLGSVVIGTATTVDEAVALEAGSVDAIVATCFADAIAPFRSQNWLTAHFRSEATRLANGELQSLWLGQAGSVGQHDDAGALMSELEAGIPRIDPA